MSGLMTGLYGSDDLFPDNARRPCASINFVTCHDGYTPHDLGAHDRRPNEANGRGNNDGMAENLSWNCGWEGRTVCLATLTFGRSNRRICMAKQIAAD